MGYREYRDYLSSDAWRERAAAAKARVGHRCQVCNGSGDTLDAHHRTYARLGSERDDDLTVLCRACHALFHQNKRGELQGLEYEWLGRVFQERPAFYAEVIAPSVGVYFGEVSALVCFGADVPVAVLDAVERQGGDMFGLVVSVASVRQVGADRVLS